MYGNWTTDFGDNERDGIAEQGGGDIYVTSAGSYTIRFNDSTHAYTLAGSCTPNCTGKTCDSDACGGSRGTCSAGSTCNASSQCEATSGSVTVNFTCNNGTTVPGQSVYVTGNHAALGNWDLAAAVQLAPSAYPTWTGSLTTLLASTLVQWKCVKRSETNPTQNVVWQGGANNAVTTPASGAVSTSASFRVHQQGGPRTSDRLPAPNTHSGPRDSVRPERFLLWRAQFVPPAPAAPAAPAAPEAFWEPPAPPTPPAPPAPPSPT